MKTYSVPKRIRSRVERVAEHGEMSFDEAMVAVLERGLVGYETEGDEPLLIEQRIEQAITEADILTRFTQHVYSGGNGGHNGTRT